MNIDNNRSAAGLRRSAIAERIRLREEWSELKGTDDEPQSNNKRTVTNILRKQNLYKNTLNKRQNCQQKKHEFTQSMQANSEVLHGVVALVEVGAEPKALALRAALTALGATVVPAWSPLVTHLVWAQGGCRATRAKARALASRLVSPLWVEACAAAARRLPEQAFPAAARASDLPSPRTLRQLLKKADMENIPLLDLLSDKEDDRENRPARLRLSSETDHDTSADTSRDTSHDTTDKTTDKSRDTTTDIESRVNTAPRRALPNSSVSSPIPKKSKRKLFTQKEDEILKRADDDSDTETPVQKRTKPTAMTQRERKELARAERMARRLVAACATPATQRVASASTGTPRVVLTGMDRAERHAICDAIRKLNGRVQSHVNRRTTHVLLGSFTRTDTTEQNCSGVTALNISKNHAENTSLSNQVTINNGLTLNVARKSHMVNTSSANNVTGYSPKNKRGASNISNKAINKKNNPKSLDNLNNTNEIQNNIINGKSNGMTVDHRNVMQNNTINADNEMRVVHRSDLQKARTLNALLGAARGCRVLYAQWAIDSLAEKKWLHHHGYEVPHLKKISQKARIERAALGKLRSEYAYDVFYGMRVRITTNADQKDAATQLLTLCGAVVQDGRQILNDGLTQNGRLTQNGGQDFDLTVGVRDGEVSSKWVFDSVAAARMRTTRRYINRIATQNTQGSVI